MTRQRLIDALIGKMQAEHAIDTSDAEIERTLSQTVAPDFCIKWAKQFRDEGVLKLK